ncbi:MAG: hypothetical protein ACHQ4J_05865 [Candidatus Binatia bacterium]
MRHSERRSAGRLALILAGCLAGFSGVAMAANLNVTWNGGSGNWEDPTKWGGGVVPNNGAGNTFNVFIDGGNGVSSAVTLYTSDAVSTLTIDQGDQLIENNGSALGIASGPAINHGV